MRTTSSPRIAYMFKVNINDTTAKDVQVFNNIRGNHLPTSTAQSSQISYQNSMKPSGYIYDNKTKFKENMIGNGTLARSTLNSFVYMTLPLEIQQTVKFLDVLIVKLLNQSFNENIIATNNLININLLYFKNFI